MADALVRRAFEFVSLDNKQIYYSVSTLQKTKRKKKIILQIYYSVSTLQKTKKKEENNFLKNLKPFNILQMMV